MVSPPRAHFQNVDGLILAEVVNHLAELLLAEKRGLTPFFGYAGGAVVAAASIMPAP